MGKGKRVRAARKEAPRKKIDKSKLPLHWPSWRVRAAFHLQYLINKGITPSFNQ